MYPSRSRPAFSAGAARDRAGHRTLPGLVLIQADGQLDHLLRLQLRGANGVEDVALGMRGRGELDDGGRVHARLHLARQAGHRLVRLIHDHQRAMEVEQVGEGIAYVVRVAPYPLCHLGTERLQPRDPLRHVREQRLQRLVVRIDLAPLCVLHAQRLDGGDEHAQVPRQVGRGQPGEIGDVEHAHRLTEGGSQRLTIVMARVVQRVHGLPADRRGRHQPQHRRIVAPDPRIARDRDAVRGEQRLAAAGGQAQADIGHPLLPEQGRVAPAIAAQPPDLVRLGRDRLVRGLGPVRLCRFEKATQRVEGRLLIGLELHQRAFTS